MKAQLPKMRFFLDEGVPLSAGRALEKSGHEVIYFSQSGIAKGSTDPMVCLAAQLNDAILLALDGDMRTIARGNGVSNSKFRRLNLLKLNCRESRAAERLTFAMSLLEHEWAVGEGQMRRFFVEVGESVIRTNR